MILISKSKSQRRRVSVLSSPTSSKIESKIVSLYVKEIVFLAFSLFKPADQLPSGPIRFDF